MYPNCPATVGSNPRWHQCGPVCEWHERKNESFRGGENGRTRWGPRQFSVKGTEQAEAESFGPPEVEWRQARLQRATRAFSSPLYAKSTRFWRTDHNLVMQVLYTPAIHSMYLGTQVLGAGPSFVQRIHNARFMFEFPLSTTAESS